MGGDTFLLFLLVSTAKNLDLLDRKDMPCRLLLFDIARCYALDAASLPDGPEADFPYLRGLSAMPENSRFKRLYALHSRRTGAPRP